MVRLNQTLIVIVIALAVASVESFAANIAAFNGTWKLIPEKSEQIDLFSSVTLHISAEEKAVTIIAVWGGGQEFKDTMMLNTGNAVNTLPVHSRIWPTNVMMGVKMDSGSVQRVSAQWEKSGTQLFLKREYTLRVSEGKHNVNETDTYEISPDERMLTLTIARSTRKTGALLRYVFFKTDSTHPYFMNLAVNPEGISNWEINGKLSENAFLISLQGLANTYAPRLYFVYPNDWDFRFTPFMLQYLMYTHHLDFEELKSPEAALEKFKSFVKGYIVWDKSVRSSLIVAFTAAGLERAVVVSEDQIPMVEKAGLNMLEDFRGKFSGQTDAQIFQWAYDQYWNRCNKNFLVWLGGEAGNVMKPGIADFGIAKHAFFANLSTKPSDTLEYALSNKIFGGMNRMAMLMGWHSYAKDKERDYTKLASHYVLRVEGLHTMPNLSFSSKLPPLSGFQFKNRHNLTAGKKYIPKKKVYIACIQTDGLGLGAWVKPGRGSIPYAWEVTINFYWLAPTMLEYFYSTATQNDFFLGALSGPGYMYPKAIPPEYLPEVVSTADSLMKKLDLNVFEIMDYSQGATVEGNTELTKNVVDAYYKEMPDAIGFVNGYAPSYTFTSRNGVPLVSYDYYLSKERPEADAVADLQELARLNPKRPYFLLVHVREWSDIPRVKAILDKLGSEFETVPLDLFLKMAGEQPTFQERFLKTK
ncbi:MAG: hypothetical protein KGJ59_00150 [Bacteroidota bacterium]|nr:hypothetical protein [Bacteroidota bacterium]